MALAYILLCFDFLEFQEAGGGEGVNSTLSWEEVVERTGQKGGGVRAGDGNGH